MHIRDAAAAIAHAALEDESHRGETYNLASGRETTIRELGEAVVAAVDPAMSIKFDASKPVGIQRRVMSIAKAQAKLGFRPAIPLRRELPKPSNGSTLKEFGETGSPGRVGPRPSKLHLTGAAPAIRRPATRARKTQTMKILHVSTWKARCGIAGYAENLVDSLDQLGVESQPFPLVPHDIHTMIPEDWEATCERICHEARSCDLVHIQHEFSFFSSPGPRSSIHNFGLLLNKLKRARCPTVATFHTELPFQRKLPTSKRKLTDTILNQLWRWNVASHFRRRASLCHGIVHGMKGRQVLFNSGASPHNISLLPMGHPIRHLSADIEQKRTAKIKLGIDPDSVVLSIFGFVGAYKGHEVAVKALKLLPKKYVLAVIGGRHPDATREPTLNNILRAWHDHDPKRLLVTGYAGARQSSFIRPPRISAWPRICPMRAWRRRPPSPGR